MIFVLIPAYNEAHHLRNLLPQVPVSIGSHSTVTLVASDGSTDATAHVATECGCMVVAATENRGKGAALRMGLEAARSVPFDAAVFMDADGQHDPVDIGRLVDPVLEQRADLAVGTRYAAGRGREQAPWNRYAVRCATSALLRRVVGQRLTDPYCGFRALSREAASLVSLESDRYQCELEMIFDACEHGWRIVEVPIAKVYGPGMSKMTTGRPALVGRAAVISQYGTTMARRSMRLRRGTSRLRHAQSSR